MSIRPNPDSPSRPEITTAPTPQTDDEWAELLWETVDEFVRSQAGSAASGSACLHLSPFTFPGGDATEGDDPYPLCKTRKNDAEYITKDVSVYPPGFAPVCDHCMRGFKHYHREGTPPNGGHMYIHAERERQKANNFDIDKYIDSYQ